MIDQFKDYNHIFRDNKSIQLLISHLMTFFKNILTPITQDKISIDNKEQINKLPDNKLPLNEQMEQYKKQKIYECYLTNGKNKSATAKALGINRNTVDKYLNLD